MLLYSGIISMITLPVKFILYLMNTMLNDYETKAKIKDKRPEKSRLSR